MHERKYWGEKIRPIWHRPQHGWVAWKVQDMTHGGYPDVDACFAGTAAKIELKFKKQEASEFDSTKPLFFSDDGDKKPCIVSPGQDRYLTEWAQADGLACVLFILGNQWWLVHWQRISSMNREGIAVNDMIREASVDGFTDTLRFVPEYFEAYYGE